MNADPTITLVFKTFERATIYTRKDFGMGWTGVRVTSFSVDAAARYGRVDLEIQCRRFRARADSEFALYGRKDLVIVKGHHAVRPIPIYGAAQPTSHPGVTIAKGLGSSCSPVWTERFDQWLSDKDVVFDGRKSTPTTIAA